MALESVKLESSVVDKVRDQKKKTAIPIGKFIEMAILEKLKRKTK